jgi:hypothetical protein
MVGEGEKAFVHVARLRGRTNPSMDLSHVGTLVKFCLHKERKSKRDTRGTAWRDDKGQRAPLLRFKIFHRSPLQ